MEAHDAFISYSHARDRRIAATLQDVLQKFGKAGARSRLRVFRDDTGLAAAPMLWPTIEQALGQSRYFILLASAEAAQSEWVNKEAAYWLEHKGIATLLIGITSGELRWSNATGDFIWDEHTPLPPALKSAFSAEPKWVDLRGYRWVDLRRFPLWRNEKFLASAANFGAPIGGIAKEKLFGQEVRQQKRDRRRRRLAVTATVIAVVASLWAVREALRFQYGLEAIRGPQSQPWDLPSGTPAAAVARGTPVVLSMSADHTLWLNNRMVGRDEMIAVLDALTSGDREHQVQLRVDRTISHDEVMKLLARLSAAGYRKVAFVVQPAEQ